MSERRVEKEVSWLVLKSQYRTDLGTAPGRCQEPAISKNHIQIKTSAFRASKYHVLLRACVEI